MDQRDSRAEQLSAALDHVVSLSEIDSTHPIYGLVDGSRLAAMGWSMGGGASLKLATSGKLKAIIPQAPWYDSANNFNEISTPTLIIGCEVDSTAPVNSYAKRFYEDIPDSTNKAYLEVANGGHNCANTRDSSNPNKALLGKLGVSWMKRFIDLDLRYDQFLCGPDHENESNVSEYRDTCSYQN